MESKKYSLAVLRSACRFHLFMANKPGLCFRREGTTETIPRAKIVNEFNPFYNQTQIIFQQEPLLGDCVHLLREKMIGVTAVGFRVIHGGVGASDKKTTKPSLEQWHPAPLGWRENTKIQFYQYPIISQSGNRTNTPEKTVFTHNKGAGTNGRP